MSGSGGFYQHRCRCFYQASCQNWIYVNGEASVTFLVSFRVCQAILAAEQLQAGRLLENKEFRPLPPEAPPLSMVMRQGPPHIPTIRNKPSSSQPQNEARQPTTQQQESRDSQRWDPISPGYPQLIQTGVVDRVLARNGINRDSPWTPSEDDRIVELKSLGMELANIDNGLNCSGRPVKRAIRHWQKRKWDTTSSNSNAQGDVVPSASNGAGPL